MVVIDFPATCWACHRRIRAGAPVAREVEVLVLGDGASVESVRTFHEACAPG